MKYSEQIIFIPDLCISGNNKIPLRGEVAGEEEEEEEEEEVVKGFA
ncbi:MAG: hypothetical protein Q3M30_20165 [Candidatus Electrothrix sp. Rat3]|nr:hypothetical protein [Candidatus Electrothrix rattekaaiensis]